MFIVIVGGGKLGYYLVKTLLPNNHKIIVFDPVKELCEKIANDLKIPVINANGTDIEKLTEIHLEKADIFIAVTGKDEDNLIACQLAKKTFGVKKTIARVNNPKNIEVFERLGVGTTVSGTSIIADLIEEEVDFSGLKTLMKLKGGKIVLSEVNIGPKSFVCNKSLKDIDLPNNCIIISVIRDEEVIIPNAYTNLHEGDYVVTVSSEEDQDLLKKFFAG